MKKLPELRLLAKQGCVKSQFYLGRLYDEGVDTDRDRERAFYWYRLSAEQGYTPAERRVGDMYRLGEGVTQDICYAMEWYRRAAQNNCSWSLQQLSKYDI